MLSERDHQTSGGELDDAIVVQYIISGDDRQGDRPGERFHFVVAEAHPGHAEQLAVASVLAGIEEGDAAVLQAQERDTHDVGVAFLGDQDAIGGGPGATTVVRMAGGDDGGAGVVATPSVAGIGKDDAAGGEGDEGALAVTRVARGRIELQDDGNQDSPSASMSARSLTRADL